MFLGVNRKNFFLTDKFRLYSSNRYFKIYSEDLPMNNIFNDNTYFDKLQNFNMSLKKAAEATALIEHLAFRGVPDGSVIFSNTKRRHVLAGGEVKEYEYTNVYLYVDGTKYYVSKKFQYSDHDKNIDTNDVANPANHMRLLVRFWMRMMAKKIIKICLDCAKMLANLLNSIKSPELPRINFEVYKEMFFEDFRRSEENQNLANMVDEFFDLPIEKQLNMVDLRPSVEESDALGFAEQIQNTDFEIMSFTKKRSKKRVPVGIIKNKKKRVWYKIRKSLQKVNFLQTNRFGYEDMNETELFEKQLRDLKYSFDSSIINDCGEQLRSKNEVITTRCAHDCGLCYELEPYYPNSFMRADLLLKVHGRNIFVEIAGSRDKPDYEARLKEKIEHAQLNNINLVIIDMTAYPDTNGKTHMRMNYSTICRIFMYIQLGMLKNGIVWPY